MEEKRKALAAAFPHTIPVMTGYLFLGAAFGILMGTKGYGAGWAMLMSVVVYAGSMQFVAVTLLAAAFHPLYAFLLTLMVNARHLFYGIAMLEKLRGTGKLKPYLIFGLTDETFSVLCSVPPPEGVRREWFLLFVTLLNQCYWVLGSALGGLLGPLLRFDTAGLDFVLTALFVVIFLNQWKGSRQRIPAVVGVLGSVACLLLFGQSNFLIPAMAAILAVLLLLRDRLEEGAAQ